MNSPAADIAQMLHDQGLAVLATNLFIDNMPTGPNDAICVINSGGHDPQVDTGVSNPTVQIMVYGAPGDGAATYARASAIVNFLHGLGNVGLADSSGGSQGARYLGIWQQSDIMRLPKDENNRIRFSLNFRLMRTELG